MSAQVERTYDEYEKMAAQAMMNRAGYHAKKLKQTQLFKRPSSGSETQDKAEERRDKAKETMEWLSQFEEFREKVGKEVVNGE